MKKLPFAIAMILSAVMIAMTSGCNSDKDNDSSKVWSKYEKWRDVNNAFYTSQRDSLDADGKPFYRVLYPTWNPAAEILIHYFNDREETAGNLQPMLTSTCDLIYYSRLCNGVPADSSYTKTEYGRGIARFCPQKTIQGFAIALMDMHVGDSVQVVLPYTLAYGASTTKPFPPFSSLVMNIRLVDIPFYEIPAAN